MQIGIDCLNIIAYRFLTEAEFPRIIPELADNASVTADTEAVFAVAGSYISRFPLCKNFTTVTVILLLNNAFNRPIMDYGIESKYLRRQ